jgi:hypothetical protein
MVASRWRAAAALVTGRRTTVAAPWVRPRPLRGREMLPIVGRTGEKAPVCMETISGGLR